MNARLDLIIDEARTALSTPDQDRLADMMGRLRRQPRRAPALTEDEETEVKRRHAAPFGPASRARGQGILARHRG